MRRLVVVDANRLKLVSSHPLVRAPINGDAQVVAHRYLLLIQPFSPTDPHPRLAVVNPDGSFQLHRIKTNLTRVARFSGLASDNSAHRAFVLTPGASAAIVDLATGAVSYRRPRGLPGLERGPLDPLRLLAAYAEPLPGNRLALVESATTFPREDEHGTYRSKAAGLYLIDTRSWQATLVDLSASGADLSNGRLLAFGPSSDEFAANRPQDHTTRGDGIRAYDLSGRLRYHLFPGLPMQIDHIVGHRVFASRYTGERPAREWTVFDARTGRILGRLPRTSVELLD
jgi:hypothetical protein